MNNSTEFVDTNGLAWESKKERDTAISSGRYIDALIAYLKKDSRFHPRIFKLYYAVRYSSVGNISASYKECGEAERFYMLVKRF